MGRATLHVRLAQIFGPTTTSADADASSVLLHISGIHRGGVLPLPDRSGAIETSAAGLATDQNWTGKGVGTGLLAAQRCVAALIGGAG